MRPTNTTATSAIVCTETTGATVTRTAVRSVGSILVGALAFASVAVLPAATASAAPSAQLVSASPAAAPITDPTATVVSVDVPGQSAVLTGTGYPGATLNIHPAGNPNSFVTGIVVSADGTWTATVPGLPVGTNNLYVDQRVSSAQGSLWRGYVTVVITAPRVIVHHTDGDGAIAPDTILTGVPASTYTAAAQVVPGFHVVSPDSTGTYGSAGSTIEVTLRYAADMGTVVTRFVDGQGNELAEPTSQDGRTGAGYSTSPANIDGWHVAATPSDATGAFPADTKTATVTYVYATDTGHVVTRYVDADGEDVAAAGDAQDGRTGTPYATSAIAVPGYHLVRTPANAAGDFPADTTTTTVEYVYALDVGTVIARYVDEHGTLLADPAAVSGPTGKAYGTTPATIPLHHLVDSSPNTTGVYPADDTSVVVTYVYARDMGTVVVRFVDKDGADLTRSTTLTGMTGATYETRALWIPNYTLVSATSSVNGVYGADGSTDEVRYVYDSIAVIAPVAPVAPAVPSVVAPVAPQVPSVVPPLVSSIAADAGRTVTTPTSTTAGSTTPVVMAQTGSEAGPLGAVAALLTAIGGVLVRVVRRSRREGRA